MLLILDYIIEVFSLNNFEFLYYFFTTNEDKIPAFVFTVQM